VNLETSNLVPACRRKIFLERGVIMVRWPVLEFYTPCKISATANAIYFKFCTGVGHAESCDKWVFSKWAWSGLREQFLYCGLTKFRHSKSSVYNSVRSRFVCDTSIVEATRSCHGRVHMSITHCPTVTLQLHNFDLLRTCRTSSFCTDAWQLARFQLTRRIARSLADSWAFCRTCTETFH